MIISKLNKEDYAGKKFIARYMTKGYYDIQRKENGFEFIYTKFDEEKEVSFEDSFFNEWLEEPVAYGAFEDEQLVGFDLYAYSNNDPEKHEVRIEMGMKLYN